MSSTRSGYVGCVLLFGSWLVVLQMLRHRWASVDAPVRAADACCAAHAYLSRLHWQVQDCASEMAQVTSGLFNAATRAEQRALSAQIQAQALLDQARALVNEARSLCPADTKATASTRDTVLGRGDGICQSIHESERAIVDVAAAVTQVHTGLEQAAQHAVS